MSWAGILDHPPKWKTEGELSHSQSIIHSSVGNEGMVVRYEKDRGQATRLTTKQRYESEQGEHDDLAWLDRAIIRHNHQILLPLSV